MSKLESRRKLYGIPEIPYLPMGKDVLVFRMPLEEKTEGGLWKPQTANEPKSYGVLVAAGLAALDKMHDHLIEVGDVVWFGTFEGEEKEIERERGAEGKYLLQMKIEGIRGSVDAVDRVKNYVVVRDDETGEHHYEKKPENVGRFVESKLTPKEIARKGRAA